MKSKIYKVKLEKNEYQSIKIISCSSDVRMPDLMRVIILTFIEYQTPRIQPIKRKRDFKDPYVLNAPISEDTQKRLSKHRNEEGVGANTIINNAITYWLNSLGAGASKIKPIISKEEIFKKFKPET